MTTPTTPQATPGPWEKRIGTGKHWCIYIQGTGHNIGIGIDREADAALAAARPNTPKEARNG